MKPRTHVDADLEEGRVADSVETMDFGLPSLRVATEAAQAPESSARGSLSPTNGWWATVSHTVTGIHCAVAVGGDMAFSTAKSGEPVCFGERDWRGA